MVGQHSEELGILCHGTNKASSLPFKEIMPRSKSPRGKSPRSKSPRGKSPRGKSPRGKSPRGKSPKSPVRYERQVGTRREVMDGYAHHTSGGLTTQDLVVNNKGAIVSKKRQQMGRVQLAWLKHLGLAHPPFESPSNR